MAILYYGAYLHGNPRPMAILDQGLYKHFSNEVFTKSFLGKLSQQTFANNSYGFQKFCSITLKTLDNTPYATANDIDSLIASLEEASKSSFSWFDNNLMKSNADKALMKK